MIILAGPIAGRLSDRIGPRPLMTAGLLIVAGSLFWQGHLAVDTSYGFLVAAFVLMGLGMGLVMSPMSTAAMNAVDPAKAGVASGILSMSRMVGGTFGVAALGALISALGQVARSTTCCPPCPAERRAQLADALGAGGAQVGGRVGDAVQDAFVVRAQRRPADRRGASRSSARARLAPDRRPAGRAAAEAGAEERAAAARAEASRSRRPASSVRRRGYGRRRRMQVLEHCRRRRDPRAARDATSSSGCDLVDPTALSSSTELGRLKRAAEPSLCLASAG